MRLTWKKTVLSAAMMCGMSPLSAMAQQYPVASLPQTTQAMPVSQQLPGQPDDLHARLDAYETELQSLRQQMQHNESVFQSAAFDMADKDKPKDKKDEKKTDDGYKCCDVGSDLKMGVRWNLNNGLTFETPCKDFVSHVGVRFQFDVVSFDENVISGPGGGQLNDGAFFRRVRPSWDGTAYDVMEWNVELALEQTQNNIPNLDAVWVGFKNMPYIDTVRIGHQKVTQGFEGDMMSSSKAMTFMERSMYTDAYYENFGSGFLFADHLADDHITWQSMVYRQDNVDDANGNNTGADFNEHGWGWSGRVTALPFYQDEGRHMLHLGASAVYRQNENLVNGGPGVTDFRARPQIRDIIGAAPFGNSTRLIDTGVVNSTNDTVLGTELFYVQGAFSLQGEYSMAWMDHATGGRVTAAGQGQDILFNGGYLQASYFLTGENRTYDRRFGTAGSTYMIAPYSPFFWVRTADCNTCWGWGAWEVAARYNYCDLNNHLLTPASQGGQSNAEELGLNWYLNLNTKIQFEYLHQNADGGPHDGNSVDGFGMRTQFFF